MKSALMKTLPGIDKFCSDDLSDLKKGKFTLMTNPTGVNSTFTSTVEILREQVNLISLLSPEHGIRGELQAGENVGDYFDEKYKLPVYSLYDQRDSDDLNKNIDSDKKMRLFDTRKEGKVIRDELISEIDNVIIDIQDIGTRIYTYLSSVIYLLEKCIEFEKNLIILDRANPITGRHAEGPILEYPDFSSFIGVYAIPMRHGMTLGELTAFINARLFNNRGSLTVVPVKRWSREQWYDQISTTWINPSPNMPSLAAATVYPGSVLFEGTNVSEGRGTTRPFEYIGAPWIDPELLSVALNKKDIPGVHFREIFFQPFYSKFKNQVCGGIDIIVSDRERFKPFYTAIAVLAELLKLFPDRFEFFPEYFDKVAGNSWIRKNLLDGISPDDIEQMYKKDVEKFKSETEEFLIY